MSVWSILVRPGCRRVRSCAFGPFPCALGVTGFVRVRSANSRAHGVGSGTLGPFPFFLRIRGPFGSSSSFVYVRSIPVRPGSRRGRSGAFGRFVCALRIAMFFRVLSAHSRALCGSCSVNFRAPLGSSPSSGCFLSIPVRPGYGRLCYVHFHSAWGSSGSFGSILVLVGSVRSVPKSHLIRSGTLGPFTCTLVILGCVRSILVHA